MEKLPSWAIYYILFSAVILVGLLSGFIGGKLHELKEEAEKKDKRIEYASTVTSFLALGLSIVAILIAFFK